MRMTTPTPLCSPSVSLDDEDFKSHCSGLFDLYQQQRQRKQYEKIVCFRWVTVSQAKSINLVIGREFETCENDTHIGIGTFVLIGSPVSMVNSRTGEHDGSYPSVFSVRITNVDTNRIPHCYRGQIDEMIIGNPHYNYGDIVQLFREQILGIVERYSILTEEYDDGYITEEYESES